MSLAQKIETAPTTTPEQDETKYNEADADQGEEAEGDQYLRRTIE